MTFERWYNTADMPVKKDGLWIDMETGIPYGGFVKQKKIAKKSSGAALNYGMLRVNELREETDRQLSNQRISLERHPGNEELIALLASYDAYNGKRMTKQVMYDLLDMSSKVSRNINKSLLK